MYALPFLISFAVALALAPLLLRQLRRAGSTRHNYRRRLLPYPFGALVLAAALAAGLPLLALARLGGGHVFHPEAAPIALYAIGVMCLGLVDDLIGSGEGAARGLRGHAAALWRGKLTTGALKAAGSVALALMALRRLGFAGERLPLAAGVLVLTTNLFNMLDLRPGRALKAFVLLGAALVAGSGGMRPLWSLGLFAAPALVAGAFDLRERALLGDTGANLLGAIAGLWLVLTLPATGQAVALALLVAVTFYGEQRSISALVARTPWLRQLDSWGRPA